MLRYPIRYLRSLGGPAGYNQIEDGAQVSMVQDLYRWSVSRRRRPDPSEMQVLPKRMLEVEKNTENLKIGNRMRDGRKSKELTKARMVAVLCNITAAISILYNDAQLPRPRVRWLNRPTFLASENILNACGGLIKIHRTCRRRIAERIPQDHKR